MTAELGPPSFGHALCACHACKRRGRVHPQRICKFERHQSVLFRSIPLPTTDAVTTKTRYVAYIAVPAGVGPSPPAILMPAGDAPPPRCSKRGTAPSAGALLRLAVAAAAPLLLALVPAGKDSRGNVLLEAIRSSDNAAALRLIAAGANVSAKEGGGGRPFTRPATLAKSTQWRRSSPTAPMSAPRTVMERYLLPMPPSGAVPT